VRCDVEPISDGLRVTVTAMCRQPATTRRWCSNIAIRRSGCRRPTTRREGGTVTGVADLVPSDHGPFALNRSDLRVTVIGTRMAVELDGCRS
jgi:hypothetical protein